VSDLINRLRNAEDPNTYVSEGDLWNLCGEAAEELERLRAENERLREALKKLRDCDWTITLPDRMDAVRDMAKQALSQGGEGV
jgi:regulator of replication initiation timing